MLISVEKGVLIGELTDHQQKVMQAFVWLQYQQSQKAVASPDQAKPIQSSFHHFPEKASYHTPLSSWFFTPHFPLRWLHHSQISPNTSLIIFDLIWEPHGVNCTDEVSQTLSMLRGMQERGQSWRSTHPWPTVTNEHEEESPETWIDFFEWERTKFQISLDLPWWNVSQQG